MEDRIIGTGETAVSSLDVGAELRMLVDGILPGDRRPGLQVDDDDGPV